MTLSHTVGDKYCRPWHGPQPVDGLRIGIVLQGRKKMRLRFARPLASSLAAFAFGCMVPAAAHAQEPTSIKVGWAISKTGPNVGGATITLLNAYKLWVKDVNACADRLGPDAAIRRRSARSGSTPAYP